MSFKARSHMTHLFSQVPSANIPRSKFDRSHAHKTAFDAGYLIPVYCDEALPGDTFSMNATGFGRLATPIYPLMDNLNLDLHFFAVPLRLIWTNFPKFMGEQVDPGDPIDYTVPVMTAPVSVGHAVGSLSDYMGIPTGVASLEHSSLFHRAYNLIYNEWYRDENLQDSVVVDRDDGPDTSTDYVLLRRGKRHDYFTSCLPWPQKGDASSLPLGTSANVKTQATEHTTSAQTGLYIREASTGNRTASSNYLYAHTNGTMNVSGVAAVGLGGAYYPTNLFADLSTATAATINQLRESFQIQKLLERDARGGTRYTEIIRSHFGVVSPDARLQRPEYLGGGSSEVRVTAVPKTSTTDGTSPQGNLAGFGTVIAQGGFNKSFTEHCVIIGLASVRADLTYQEGLNRMFSRSTRYDFYWPALAQIGEQEVLQGEIYADGTANDDIVFGYQERYAEYRYKPSIVTGLLRSNASGTLDSWHLAQDFTAAPTLNAAFIVEDPPIDRCIAVPTEPHFIFDSYFRLKCARPMPVYGVPGFIDHF